ncbi:MULTISPECIES: ogr/Delta-like zinc finger family protein [unclassified Pseudodesulfovibrio]|uniref:ogr/Delta-like zinc finger family protein n=1 Tax=unclassified Pseudodesulfovibrio TaxID=2661612 RepID=UPI000FEBE616|nr:MULTISPECIES: ogr/Delta-like zinc finger family protein [unclassified Pseudodesulfovibrio]MCJ2164644.1 ogr/Delta-like zinc finger family protein [Pseudodesulfovibrio sp. S3-i]RWU04164.1 transcriptional regulator [Pseudodesulfovibrio sp. S3]
MAFRVYCPICKRVARIESSNSMSRQFKQAYCACSNPECGHTFVMNVEFSHTLSPSALSLSKELRDRIRETAPTEQGSLFSTEPMGG